MEKTGGGRGEDPIAPERQNVVRLCEDGQSLEKNVLPLSGLCLLSLLLSGGAYRGKNSSPVARLANVTKCQEVLRLTPANCVSVL